MNKWTCWGGFGWPEGINEAMGWDKDSVPEGVWWPVCGPGGRGDVVALVHDKYHDQQHLIASAPDIMSHLAEVTKQRDNAREALRAAHLALEAIRGTETKAECTCGHGLGDAHYINLDCPQHGSR